MNNCICNKPSIRLLGQIRNLFRDIKNNGGFSKVPKALIHYNFGLYTNEDFINDENKLVRDLSGNGHDLKLYNFAFAGMSGFGGYVTDYSKYVTVSDRGTVSIESSTKFKVTEVLRANLNVIDDSNKNVNGLSSYIIKVVGTFPDGSSMVYRARNNEDNSNIYLLTISSSGIYTLPEVPDNCGHVGFQFTTTGTCDLTIEQLPQYPGGLVSDGVDDYGECVKQFMLTDFTVVALRDYANFTQVNNATLVAKTTGYNANGAFLFEDGINMDCISFGSRISNSDSPALFSYLTKTSFNGKDGTPGTTADADNALLHLFSRGSLGTIPKKQAVLYDLRIYDHSLTTEELQLVKDEMMSDYEAATGGGIADITYVADWDGKDRSNKEDEPMRSQWVDKKTGKVIELHNFGYAGMSGWGGYTFNLNDWSIISGGLYDNNIITKNASKLYFSGIISDETKTRAGIMLPNVPSGNTYQGQLKITGLKPGQQIAIGDYTGSPARIVFTTSDGILSYNFTTSTGGSSKMFLFLELKNNTRDVNVVVEQLPLYPGALVGDGIDDYGVTQEAINEEVGTVLLHYRRLIEVPTKWGYYFDSLNQTRIYAAYPNTSPYFHSNLMEKYNDGNLFIGTTSRTADAILHIMANNANAKRGQVAIFRLILIREQLDGAQVEFLRWKVDKEYREWIKKNGYINEQ